MLTISITIPELWDETNEMFIKDRKVKINLEHSLISISKWESKYQRPFLKPRDVKTDDELLYYIKCMTINKNVDDSVYNYLSIENLNKINEYISSPMTATTFCNTPNQSNKEIPTSELIYYWMITNNIPIECQYWHLNRLITLIRVCSVKNAPPKKISKKALIEQYASLNSARRSQLNSSG